MGTEGRRDVSREDVIGADITSCTEKWRIVELVFWGCEIRIVV